MGAGREGFHSGLCFSGTSLSLPLPSSPGETAVPNENPAQRVFLLPDFDWGAHFQVSKGVEAGNVSFLGPSSHIAKIWTLRWEKHMPTVGELRLWVKRGWGPSLKINLATGRNSASVGS